MLEENDNDEVMNIYSPWGTLVTFLNKNGYDYERELAAKVFEPGKIYEVDYIVVGNSSSIVKLVGVAGEWNTVMFGPAGKVKVFDMVRFNQDRTELYGVINAPQPDVEPERVHLTNIKVLSIDSTIHLSSGVGRHRVRYLENANDKA